MVHPVTRLGECPIRNSDAVLSQPIQSSLSMQAVPAPEGKPARRSRGMGGCRMATERVGADAERLGELRFLTVAEVASVMRVSKMTVYRLVNAGTLQSSASSPSARNARSEPVARPSSAATSSSVGRAPTQNSPISGFA